MARYGTNGTEDFDSPRARVSCDCMRTHTGECSVCYGTGIVDGPCGPRATNTAKLEDSGLYVETRRNGEVRESVVMECDPHTGYVAAGVVELERVLYRAPEIIATDLEATDSAFAEVSVEGDSTDGGVVTYGTQARLVRCVGEIDGQWSALEIDECDLMIDGDISQCLHATNSRIECDTVGGINSRRWGRKVRVSFTDCDLRWVTLTGCEISEDTFVRCRCVGVLLRDCTVLAGVVLPEGVTVCEGRKAVAS